MADLPELKDEWERAWQAASEVHGDRSAYMERRAIALEIEDRIKQSNTGREGGPAPRL